MRFGWALAVIATSLAALGNAGAAPTAANPPARWESLAETSFDHFSHADGLSHDYVTALAQDRDGFLWIGTEGGIDRFDGYRFKVYRWDADNADSLPSNFVLTLHIDRQGRLWVGTQASGLALFDTATDHFVRFGAGPGRLSSPEISSIADDGPDGLWVGTWDGLDRFDPATGRSEIFRHDAKDPASLPNDQIWSLLTDRTGTLWIGTGSGLVRRRPGAAGFENVTASDPATARALNDSISALFQDSRGRLWIGTFRSGAVMLDPASGAAQKVPEPPGGLGSAQINRIAEPQPDVIWMGTDGAGIEVVQADNGHARRLQHDPLEPESLKEDHATSLLRDSTGMMWVGTTNGLDRYDSSVAAIATIHGGAGHSDGISDSEVMATASAESGLVWLGLGTLGVDVLDPQSRRVAGFRPNSGDPQHALPVGSVNALAVAPDDSAWIGSDHGLYHADAGARTIELVKLTTDAPAPLVRSLYASRDEIWVGTSDGLIRYRTATHEVQLFAADPDGNTGLTDGRIMAIQPIADGRYWIGTKRGLNLLDPDKGVIERILPDPDDRNGLSDGTITALKFDREGRLWIGFGGSGINVLERRDANGKPLFRHLGTRDGLPDTLVDAILSDGRGRLWVSTDNRLAEIDPASFKIRPILAAEGVRITSYWQESASTTPDGELLFGGSGGLTIVRPELLRPEAFRPPIAVTDARIGEHPLPAESFNRDNPPALVLSPGDRGFQIEFAGLDLLAADREQYGYRLDGFDTDWIDAPHRVATYTNLPPGEYNLHLRVRDRTDSWLEDPHAIPVLVLPEWFQTLWFKILAGIATMAALSGLMQLRTASLRRRRAELEGLVSMRTAELVAANERLESLATTDALTGVLNRRRFMEIIEIEMERSRRLGHPLCVALSDLDNFKHVNDQFGHIVGDTVLRIVADRFRHACRRIDSLARYGGEEFIVLMPETTLEAAVAGCERLRASIASTAIPTDDRELGVTVSIGVARWNRGTETIERLIDRADKALYAAKEAGKNRVERAS